MNIPRVFVIGAGASAADLYPLTSQLILAIAGFLKDHSSHDATRRQIREYLYSVHHINAANLRDAAQSWKNYLDDPIDNWPSGSKLPGIIEVLSLLDIAIADETNYGPNLLHHGIGPRRQFSGNELVQVRSHIVEALIWAFSNLAQRLDRPKVTHQFVNDVLASDDAIITTNWDTLLDDAIHEKNGVPANYGGHRLRLVDALGNDLSATEKPLTQNKLLKIHGSFSWLNCRRCSEFYVNTQLFDPLHYSDLTCHCGSELQELLVAPTFGKKYNNYHLGAIWRDAQDALTHADDWVFIGYSLPPDDLWIRAMLLRALGIRRFLRNTTRTTVVNYREDLELAGRYHQMFGKKNVAFFNKGFADWCDSHSH